MLLVMGEERGLKNENVILLNQINSNNKKISLNYYKIPFFLIFFTDVIYFMFE